MAIAEPKSKPKLDERASMHEWDHTACQFVSRDECGPLHGRAVRVRWQSNFEESQYQRDDRFADPVEEKFNFLADRWERETRNMSSPNAAERHPAYRKIIELGRSAIPFILNRMVEYPGFWFLALLEMSGEANDPVQRSMYGNVEAMTNAWLSWGEKNGLRSSQD